MPLDINCFKIDADINDCSTSIKIGDYKQVGVMFPYEDLDRASLSIVDCVADFELLVPSAIRIYDTSFVPFKGSEVTEENKERFKEYMDTVMIPLFNMTPENAYIYTKLALGGQRWVVILGIEEGTEAEQNLFQVFGITSGLYVKSKTVDKANQAYLSVTMSQVNSQYPAVFLFDTDKATTEAKIDSWLDYDLVYGGTIANGGNAYLAVRVGEIGYIKLPNSAVLTTNISGIIDETYTGIGGAITYYLPKGVPFPSIEESGIAGNITFTGEKELVAFNNVNITGITAYKVSGITTSNNTNMSYLHCSLAEDILVYNCDSLVSFDAPNADMIGATNSENLANITAPKAINLQCGNCALTYKSIGDILYQAYVDNRANVVYDFSGGTNATYDEVKTYIFNTYGIPGQTVVDALDVTGEILFNE